jgi:monoamine oxidase
MGSVIKVHAVYPAAFWRDDGLTGTATGDLPTVQYVADSSGPGGAPGVLTGFITGRQAVRLGQVPPTQRRVAVLADLGRYFGPRAARPRRYLETDWSADRWAGGGFTAFLPPGVWTGYGEALRHPSGRIHWAGAETATRWMGFMDGAVRSGEDAAAAVLARL